MRAPTHKDWPSKLWPFSHKQLGIRPLVPHWLPQMSDLLVRDSTMRFPKHLVFLLVCLAWYCRDVYNFRGNFTFFYLRPETYFSNRKRWVWMRWRRQRKQLRTLPVYWHWPTSHRVWVTFMPSGPWCDEQLTTNTVCNMKTNICTLTCTWRMNERTNEHTHTHTHTPTVCISHSQAGIKLSGLRVLMELK